ncbi:hypothetical protein N8940_00750 [Sphingomonadaceae bacterium]|nr:hypothetical protein [Sphingomonadaceae bacterium]
MRKFISGSIAAAAALGLAVPAYAAPVTLEYRLPKATVGFAVSHTITQCPDGSDKPLLIDVTTGIVAVYGAGDPVRLNASGALFVDRAFKLGFYDNGTLKSFNASSDGQGGKLVVSAIKLAVTAASIFAGTPVPKSRPGGAAPPIDFVAPTDALECHERIKTLIDQKRDVASHLRLLESRTRDGDTSASLAEQITTVRAAIAALTSQLTVKGNPVYWSPSAGQRQFKGTATAGNLEVWFKPIASEAEGKISTERLQKYLLRAGYGQMQEFAVTGMLPAISSSAVESEKEENSDEFTIETDETYRALIYREPVRVTAAMKPSEDFLPPAGMNPVNIALANQRYNATINRLKPLIPQIGRLVQIPFDGSGLFGSRAVAATFNEAGGLTSVGYTTTGGADALAGVVDGVNTAATDLRDARLGAIKREIELITKEEELRRLIEGDAPVDQ